MKKTIYKIAYLILVCIAFLLTSCKEETKQEEFVDQLFRPADFTAIVNMNEVALVWLPIANASYSLEISQDSLQFQKNLKVFALDGVYSFTISELINNARYSARIKAISKNALVKDSKYKQITFITK